MTKEWRDTDGRCPDCLRFDCDGKHHEYDCRWPALVMKLDTELHNIIPDQVMRKVAIQRILRVVFVE